MTLSYTSNNLKSDFTIRICNALGKTIYTEKIKEEMYSFSKQVDFNSMPKGIYLVELTAEHSSSNKPIREVRKLVLQ